jgi:drug/metabolite transporter (DMT)-like permease
MMLGLTLDKEARRGIASAIAAAVLFGASTPFAKRIVGDVSPTILAGLLYLGSGVGLWIARIVRDRGFAPSQMHAAQWPWFAGAIAFGGVVAPVLLMFGLARISSTSASLLLNLEAVFTALIAWMAFRENADRRIVLGMAVIVAGGLVLEWPRQGIASGDALGALCIGAACLCWAMDNNLTRKVSASDAIFIAGTKGLIAGLINLALGLLFGGMLPTPTIALDAMTIGLVGYGISLVLFVLALRALGSARTGAYFSTAPFIGSALAIVLFHESATPAFWIAAALMAFGVWLHLTERHEHEHTHETMLHTHPHRHDMHHQHEHGAWDGTEPHVHEHEHQPMTHTHAHYPDVHHRHEH